MRSSLLALLVATAGATHAQSSALPLSAVVNGYVLEDGTDEPLPYATVMTVGRPARVTANVYGFFSLTTAAPDSARVTFRYLGYRPDTLTVGELVARARSAGGVVRVRLRRGSVAAREAVVTAERVRLPAAGVAAISVEEAERLPALLGEVDPVRIQQLLPGVSGGVEGTSGLQVRGGSPDQTLLLLDGVPVYNASHLFGFFSTFNPASVKSVELLRGGVPARYGGRLASVLDVQTREGGGGARSGEASVGLTASHVRVEGPLGRQRDSRTAVSRPAAYAVAFRQTYAGLLARPFQTGDTRANYGFGDLNVKLSFSPGLRDRVYVSVYAGQDAFTTQSESGAFRDRGRLAWGNLVGTVRWARPVGQRSFIEGAVVTSRYGLAVTSESTELPDTGTSTSEYRSGLYDVGATLRAETFGGPAGLTAVRAGIETTRHGYRPGQGTSTAPDGGRVASGSEPLSAWEGVAYAEADIRPVRAVLVNVGVRASAFRSDGRTYAGAVYGAVEPRLAARVEPVAGIAMTASLAGGVQYVHLLANSGLGLPTDLWLPSTARVRPERGRSATVGLELRLPARAALSVEGYYRPMTGLIDYQNGAGFFNTAGGNWEGQVVQGRGRAYGAEVLLRRTAGATTGWLAYTLARTERQFDALNGGAWFPYRYDRTHDAAAVLTHRTRRGTDLSATWTYATGDAVTLPLGRSAAFEVTPGSGYALDSNEDETEVYSARGAFRAPPSHRLDLSATFNRRRGRTDRSLTIGLYNAYNRANPLYLALRREYVFVPLAPTPDGIQRFARIPAGSRLYKFGFLPTLPSLSYRVRF